MATLARLVLSLAAALALVGHPASRIPPGVRTVDVHSSRGVSRRVTDPLKVTQIVRWFDALPIAPNVILYCPFIRYRPPTTFVFRSASGTALARARTPGHAACGASFDLRIGGKAQKPVLAGGRFLQRVGRLLGLRLVPIVRR
ncbi:MAG TPA: hypothetical protein VH541_00545 [Gaiellaceae bacterium]|jgi:hypothetical protein